LKRAKELSAQGKDLFGTPTLVLFLKNNFTKTDFEKDELLLDKFSKLDDNDIITSVKVWVDCGDKILSKLCSNLLDRKLYKIEMQNTSIATSLKNNLLEKVCAQYKISRKEAGYFVFTDAVNNSAYNATNFNINILMGNGKLIDVAEASDQLNIQSLSTTVTKYFICYPKDIKI
ncbi:MAG: phosphohydrolase, partial [Bacteroidia bacterium]